MSRYPTILIAALSWLFFAAPLFAQEATAGLSSPATGVGRPVEIVVTIRDARSAEVPQSLDVSGLRIDLLGRSTRFEMNNFKVTSSLTYTYSVLPQRAGEFDIPPFEVRVGNKVLRTNPLRLSVADTPQMQPPPSLPSGGSQSMPSPQRGVSQSKGLPYFGELVLSKKKAYVGEVIPAELRYYFNASIGGEVGDRPNLAGEGFTVQKFANVPKREQIVNGENYSVFAFQTAITAAKSGALEIPPAKLEARLQLPGSAPAVFDDFFRQFGGAAPPGMFTNTQEVAIETAATSLEILPLPKVGRPDDFAGAIGKFKMEATVSPKKAGPGDPVTLRVVVSGQGNFDAMGAPVLVGDDEWRSYPPSEKIQSSDAINYVGEKTYEFLLVARSDQSQTPGIRFSYFDPESGKYEFLTQEPVPVQARAGQVAASTSESEPDQKKAVPPPAAEITPIYAGSERAGGASRWTSLFVHPAFQMANAALGVIWVLTLVALFIWRSSSSPSSLQRQKLRRLKTRLAALEACSDSEFAARAVEILLVALSTESAPLNAGVLVSKLPLDDEAKAILTTLLAYDAESKYSASGAQALERDTRVRILSALKKITA